MVSASCARATVSSSSASYRQPGRWLQNAVASPRVPLQCILHSHRDRIKEFPVDAHEVYQATQTRSDKRLRAEEDSIADSAALVVAKRADTGASGGGATNEGRETRPPKICADVAQSQGGKQIAWRLNC